MRKKNSRLVDSISQYNIRKNKIFSVIQKKPLGLGHAIWCAREYIDGPFAVILPDDLIFSKTPCIKQLVDQYYKYGKSILGVQEVNKDQVNRYGIIKTTTNHLAKKNFLSINIPKLPYCTTEQAIEIIKNNLNKLSDWVEISKFVPKKFKKNIGLKKSGVAGMLAASLELTKEGLINIMQKKSFDKVLIKNKNE